MTSMLSVATVSQVNTRSYILIKLREGKAGRLVDTGRGLKQTNIQPC